MLQLTQYACKLAQTQLCKLVTPPSMSQDTLIGMPKEDCFNQVAGHLSRALCAGLRSGNRIQSITHWQTRIQHCHLVGILCSDLQLYEVEVRGEQEADDHITLP